MGEVEEFPFAFIGLEIQHGEGVALQFVDGICFGLDIFHSFGIILGEACGIEESGSLDELVSGQIEDELQLSGECFGGTAEPHLFGEEICECGHRNVNIMELGELGDDCDLHGGLFRWR